MLASLLPLAVVVAGCASGVERSADERAERAATVMHRERHGSAADMALRVIGGDPENDTAIEALVVEGDRFDGRIVLRITERIDSSGFDTRDPEAVRCYEYLLKDGSFDLDPERIDCPDQEAIELQPSAPEPTIPPGVADVLREHLEALELDARNEARILDVAREAAQGAPIVEVATDAGVIGVVIGNGGDQCVAAFVSGNSLEVWRVPKVLARPGEIGCSALAAARGQGQRHPH